MKIAISGTHFVGKSTLIQDLKNKYDFYQVINEPYYHLAEEGDYNLEYPTLESLIQQLDCSLELIEQHAKKPFVLYDRCPADFIAYAMHIAAEEGFELQDTELGNRLSEIVTSLQHLDLIVFVPIIDEFSTPYTEESPELRFSVDQHLKNLYRTDLLALFPEYNNPQIIELFGERDERLSNLTTYLS